MFIGDVGESTLNTSEIARVLVKSRLCCKRNGYTLFCDFFVSNSILLVLVVGQILTSPPSKYKRRGKHTPHNPW